MSIGYKLKKTQHRLRIAMDDALRKIDLTTPKYAVLSTLSASPGISNANLARASFVTPQTMHGIVANLEETGFVKRSKDPEHGRILRTELTQKGIKILQQTKTIIEQVEVRMTSALTKKELSQLEVLLEKCLNAMNQ